jgi:hypothetical protein
VSLVSPRAPVAALPPSCCGFGFATVEPASKVCTTVRSDAREGPRAHDAGRGEGADTLSSTHLHLIVNWLEIEALSSLIGAQAAKQHVANLRYYRWIYATVIRDWQPLGELYASRQLVPILQAHEMSPEDLALAARLDEA